MDLGFCFPIFSILTQNMTHILDFRLPIVSFGIGFKNRASLFLFLNIIGCLESPSLDGSLFVAFVRL